MERWVGKVAIVTGTSSGIGAAIARRLVEEGVNVVGIARRVELVEQLAQELKDQKGQLHALKADVSLKKDILRVFEWTSRNLGPVSILVNNAAVSIDGTLLEGDVDNWRTVLDTNVLGLCIATREAVKIMRANNIDGHIIHIGSILGQQTHSVPRMNLYPPTKFAVRALTESLRQELNRIGSKIKISSICPGLVNTGIAENNNFDLDFKTMPQLQPEDVADSTLYILGTPPHVQVHELTIKPIGEKI